MPLSSIRRPLNGAQSNVRCSGRSRNHQGANETYLDEGVKLLELARRAHILFKKQEPREQRRLLDFVVSNCTWKNGELHATYRQPFDLLAAATRADRELVAARGTSEGRFENWLPGQDSNLRPSD